MSLERRYRRLVRLFPARWRAAHGEELLATLLDAAPPGRRRVPVADVLDLARAALVLHARAALRRVAPGPGRGRVPGPLPALGALVATVLVGVAVRSWWSDVSVEFLVTSLVVAVVPGSGVVFTISSSLGGGWRRGLFAAVGCTFGIVPHVLMAMLGLSGVMQASATAFEVVRWIGVTYLVFMGVAMLRERGSLRLDPDRRAASDPMRTVVRRGILLNLLNPKLTVFFFAFLPQFLDTSPGLLDPRLVVLGAVFMLTTLVVFAVYAWISAAIRDRVLGTPAIVRWAQRTLGTVVIAFAARLAVTDA